MFSTNDKRAMNQGFGDGMARSFELVATPMVFGGLGYLLDRAIGTMPVLTVVLGLFGIAGVLVRAWYGYDAEMRGHEAAGRWARREETAPASPAGDLWSARRDREA